MAKPRICFLVDSYEFETLAIQRLIREHGKDAYADLIVLRALLRRSETLNVRVTDLELYAPHFRVDVEKLQARIATMVDERLINLIDGCYLDPYIVADSQKYESKRAHTRDRVTRYRDARETREKRETSSCSSSNSSKDLDLKKDLSPPPGRKQFGEGGHVWLSEADHEKLVQRFGATFADRCIEKLDAWVAQKPNTERKRKGMNGAASIRSWVIASVSEEQAKAQKIQGNGPLKPHQVMSTQQRTAMETNTFFEEREKNANK